MIGQMLGHFRIESKLGEGGMGVVYKATDTHLDRPIAIKVLRPEAVTSSERKQRFVQEAKAASALNHHNILHVYDVDEDSGVVFIAMEYVKGQTLDQSIPRKGLRLADALKYAVQIADALAAAHAAGIVHRDLKPANLMVTHNGLLKVLDFGLAKLIEPQESDDMAPTETMKGSPQTEEGVILGTVAYMSPEQAEGKKIDSRSDIFSFGSVLYEMLTGRRPFQGETKMSTLSAILSKDPRPPKELAPELPLELDRILTRCLRKDRDRRFQHMADLKVALEELKEESISGELVTRPSPLRRRLPKWAAGTAVAILIAGSAAGFLWWRSLPARSGGFSTLTRLTADSGLTTDPCISTDGKLVAYASDRSGEGNLDIWVQQVSGGQPLRLTHHEADDSEPSFSPDGSQIAFRSERDGGGIYLVSTLGGEERLFARQGVLPRFSPDGSWIAYSVGQQSGDIFAPNTRKVYVAPAAGGPPKQLAPDFAGVVKPVWAPDGKHVLFLGMKEPRSEVDWWVAPLEGGMPIKTGALGVLGPQDLFDYPEAWSSDGKSVIFSTRLGDSTNLWQIPVSLKTWHVAGPAQRLTTGSGIESQASVAQSGRMVFSSLNATTHIWSLPILADLGKVSSEIQQLTRGATKNDAPHLSVDGQKMAFASDRSGHEQIWLKDLPTGKETPVSTGSSYSYRPVISPDGSKVAYAANENQVPVLYLASGGPGTQNRPQESFGVPEKMCERCCAPYQWSFSGDKILCMGFKMPRAIVLFRLGSHESTDLLRHPELNLYDGSFSPDDRWIAFHARVNPERLQVFIAPFRDGFAAPGAKEWIPVTDASSSDRTARWSPNGNLLYFLSERDGFLCLWAQPLDPSTKRPAGAPIEIYHLHHSRRSLKNVESGALDLAIARDKLVFPIAERTGNIWKMQLPSKE